MDLPLPALFSGKGFKWWRGWFLFFGQETVLPFQHCSAPPQSILAPGCLWLTTQLYGYGPGSDGHLKCFVQRNASSTAENKFFWKREVFFRKNSSPSLIFCIPWHMELSQVGKNVFCWRGEEHTSLCLLQTATWGTAPATEVPFYALFPQKKALWATQTHIINYPTEGATQNSLNVSIPVIP